MRTCLRDVQFSSSLSPPCCFSTSNSTESIPNETPITNSYVYDIQTDTWETRTGLPEGRQRGGAANVLYERKIYVAHGGGHNQPALVWFDAYDIDNDEWITELPDAPNAREHVGGGLVHGELLCVGGGRDQGQEGDSVLNLPTDCYNFTSGTWSEEEAIPHGRRGSGYGTTCDGKFIVAGGEGGEGSGQTWANVEVFDGVSWTALDSLNRPRHGHGLAIDCTCNQMYVAAGASDLFVSTLASVETYFPNGIDKPCSADE